LSATASSSAPPTWSPRRAAPPSPRRPTRFSPTVRRSATGFQAHRRMPATPFITPRTTRRPRRLRCRPRTSRRGCVLSAVRT